MAQVIVVFLNPYVDLEAKDLKGHLLEIYPVTYSAPHFEFHIGIR